MPIVVMRKFNDFLKDNTFKFSIMLTKLNMRLNFKTYVSISLLLQFISKLLIKDMLIKL